MFRFQPDLIEIDYSSVIIFGITGSGSRVNATVTTARMYVGTTESVKSFSDTFTPVLNFRTDEEWFFGAVGHKVGFYMFSSSMKLGCAA